MGAAGGGLAGGALASAPGIEGISGGLKPPKREPALEAACLGAGGGGGGGGAAALGNPPNDGNANPGVEDAAPALGLAALGLALGLELDFAAFGAAFDLPLARDGDLVAPPNCDAQGNRREGEDEAQQPCAWVRDTSNP